tara:strand:- start:398 stop:2611 length:2214 start_codon:yes stop_codon:yes gene_type:complete
MSKNVIVSNRLPVQVTKLDNSFEFRPSTGGLATGLSSIHKNNDSIWIGWDGISSEKVNKISKSEIKKSLKKLDLIKVELNEKEIDEFYYGFSNKCIWPLFHYFIEFSRFNKTDWESYFKVNEKFCKKVVKNASINATVWVHDYQLLLLPKMIKELRPDLTIGFFLHIPFPSFEIFRIFPWRSEVLEGLLGSDLIGFHTFDYQRHFLSSVKRILRLEVDFNKINLGDREVVVNTFPMGIDYSKFNEAARKQKKQKKSQRSELKIQLDLHKKSSDNSKLILSIDRLDYTKGVLNRLKAFEIFLEKYPVYLEDVRMVMLCVPSRSNVSQYKKLKRETDEIVGRINGKFATVNWTPIWYYYREMSFEDLIDLYMISDIAMITPVRDGMNLVAKEFIASRVDMDGVLILSEMAGAAKELFEAVTVNPFDLNSMADSILKAIKMPKDEQKRRNNTMQKRLKRYTVKYWANEFFRALNKKSKETKEVSTKKISNLLMEKLKNKYENSAKRLFLLDYDGTLVDFHHKPVAAIPKAKVLKTIEALSSNKKNTVVIISGRDSEFLEKWFGKLDITLYSEHGHFKKSPKENWIEKSQGNKSWKENFLPIFQDFTDRTPGTFTEEKNNCLVWHYRKTDPELASDRVVEFKTIINSLISESLVLIDGNKAIEITNSNVNKGSAVNELTENENFDFIFCAGDDVSDENMFLNLPEKSISVKVGKKTTKANYYIENPSEMIGLIKKITNVEG